MDYFLNNTLYNFLYKAFYFLLLLGPLVFVHELGHFLVAKKAGIRVERFSLGFPPKAFGVTVGETEYCISWLPLGGYVKVAGMADFGPEEVKGEPWEFQSKPRWIQMAVMAGGPAMNFLLGFLLIVGLRIGVGDSVFNTTRIGRLEAGSPLLEAGLQPGDRVTAVEGEPVAHWKAVTDGLAEAQESAISLDILREGAPLSLRLTLDPSIQVERIEPFVLAEVGSVMPGYPAEGAGFRPGDRIVAVAGEPVTLWWELKEEVSARPGQEIEIRWVREGMEMSTQIVPRAEGTIGIQLPMTSMARVPVGVAAAIERSGYQLVQYTTILFSFIKRLVFGQESLNTLAGPLGIAKMAGQSAQRGWESFLSFMALLSVNLAVLNLLPIPVLDGGHLMILSIEAVIRRPLSIRQKEVLQQIGFVFLLFLMIYVTFNDISR